MKSKKQKKREKAKLSIPSATDVQRAQETLNRIFNNFYYFAVAATGYPSNSFLSSFFFVNFSNNFLLPFTRVRKIPAHPFAGCRIVNSCTLSSFLLAGRIWYILCCIPVWFHAPHNIKIQILIDHPVYGMILPAQTGWQSLMRCFTTVLNNLQTASDGSD